MKSTGLTSGQPPRLASILLLFLIILAGVEFVYRGPMRALGTTATLNDFISPYVQSRAWLLGQDPYDPEAIPRLWPPSAGDLRFLAIAKSLPGRHGIPSPYPLTGFPLLCPLSIVPWRPANLIWIAVVLISFALAVYSTGKIAGLRTRGMALGWLLFAALALAPFHTAIATENPALPVFALGVTGVLCAERRHSIAATVLLAAALGLKPTIALPFLAYVAARRHWRVSASAAVGASLLFLLADLRLSAAGTSWLPSFLRNSRQMFGPGGVDDFSGANVLRFNLLNLQVVAAQFLRQRGAAQVAAWVVYSLLLIVWFWSVWKPLPPRKIGLLDLGILATTALLPFYHRFYDAVVLLLPLAWAIASFSGQLQRYARSSLVLTAAFLLPGPALLEYLVFRFPQIGRMSHLWWWNLLVVSHEVWAILLLSLVLLAARWKLNGLHEKATA